MKLEHELLALLALSTFFFAIDRNRCNDGNLILFFHHLIGTFFRFWWLSNNYYLLVLFALSPFLYFSVRMLNNDRCPLTKMHNKKCILPENTKFDDLFNKIGLSKFDWWMKYGDKIFVVVVWFFVVYKLYRKERSTRDSKGQRLQVGQP